MKKQNFLCMMMLLPMMAMAYDAEIDGIYYNFNGTEATVTYKLYESGTFFSDYSGDIVIPCSVNYNNIDYNVTSIDEYAFRACEDLTSITIPNNVTSIGYGAFEGCSSLTSITIPNSVTTVRSYAFSNCKGLTSITIPNSVTSIGDYAFSGCEGITAFMIEGDNVSFASEDGVLFNKTKTILLQYPMARNETAYVIPNSVKTIGNGAFSGCKLISIDIPNGVTTIGNSAFSGCKLISIDIPNSVMTIGNSAFNNCSGLTSITIPNGVTTIGVFTFFGCYNLTSIDIPNSVTTIGAAAFYNCSGLTSIMIPNGVTSIGREAFSGCDDLTSFTIPNSVTTIGYYVFSSCNNLSDIFCYAKTVPTTDSNAFQGAPINNISLHVPAGSIDAYEASAPWSDFKQIVESDYLDAADLNIMADESNTQDISLNNGLSNLVGFQMDLTLPEGIGIDKTGCSLSDRITDEDQELTIGKLESGAYRVTSTSLSLTPISGNEGTLFSLKLTAEDGCIGGQATISNIIFSTVESEEVNMSDKTFDINIIYKVVYKVDGEVYRTDEFVYNTQPTPSDEPTKEGYTFGGWGELPETMPNHDVEITGRFYLYGDVNTDEEVDVVDVVDIARFVVATPSVNFREKLADLNFDNIVNIADAVSLVNYIAGDQNFAKAMTPKQSYDYDQCQLQLLGKQDNALSLCLDGDVDFTAFQLDVELPENTDVTAMRINGQRKNGHQVLFNKVADNLYRVAALSLSNEIFKGNEGELLSISIDGLPTDEISVSNVLLVTKNGTGIVFDDISLSGTVSEITNVNVNVSEIGSIIFDLQGRQLPKAQRGVNIINGKKVYSRK